MWIWCQIIIIAEQEDIAEDKPLYTYISYWWVTLISQLIPYYVLSRHVGSHVHDSEVFPTLYLNTDQYTEMMRQIQTEARPLMLTYD